MDKNDVPEWFVYDTLGDLDVEATLASVPAKLNAGLAVFGKVPEWFDVCSPEEIDGLIREFDDAPLADREKLTAEEIATVHANLKKMFDYYSIYRREGLSANQKELMRCLCYWLSLKTMSEIPLPQQEVE